MNHAKPCPDGTTRLPVTLAPASALTPTEARGALCHYALLAELNAYRYGQAMSVRRYTAAVHSERGYMRAARMCRVVGELARRSTSSRPSRGRAEGDGMDLDVSDLVPATRAAMRAQRA